MTRSTFTGWGGWNGAATLAAVLLGLSAAVWAQEITTPASGRLSDIDLPGLKKPFNLTSIEDLDVVQLIEYLAHTGGLNNIVIGKGVGGSANKIKLTDATVGDALEVVLYVNQLAYEIKGGIITIMPDAEYQALHGVSFYDQKKVKIVDLKYADAERVTKMLEPIKSTIGKVVADTVTGTMVLIDTPEKIAEMEHVIAKADIDTIERQLPTTTKSFPLQYANVEEVEAKVKPLLTKEAGTLQADARTKTLVVTDLPHVVDRITDLVAIFDQRPKQVFIEAKIVEVTLNDTFKLGIDWKLLMEGLGPRYTLGATVTPSAGYSSPVFSHPEDAITRNASRNPVTSLASSSVGSLTYQTVLGGGDLMAILDALKTVGDTRILSNPHVAALDGQEASIKVVTDQPYEELQYDSGKQTATNTQTDTNPNAVVGQRFIFIEVGVTFKVTPQVNDEGMISMSIRPEVSSVVGNYTTSQGTTVPIVRKSDAETKVMIKDGETIIIAGMIEDKSDSQETSVPLLGRIPLLGYFFRSTANAKTKSETIVFMTPRIITGTEPVMLLDDMKKEPKPLRTGLLEAKQTKPVRLPDPEHL